jgi:hypothetical protein
MPKRPPPPPFMDPRPRSATPPLPVVDSSGGSVILQKLAPALPGAPQMLLCERYAVVTGHDGRTLFVTWDGATDPEALHYFHRVTGQCVQSHEGVMRGWSIAAHEMPRFAPRS